MSRSVFAGYFAGANELGENYDWQTQRNRLEERQLEAVEFLLAELEFEQIFHFSSTITLQFRFWSCFWRDPQQSVA